MLLVENVKKAYREPDGEWLPILDVPRLGVGAGEQVVIRGRSGCGKTTLLNVIAGLATPDTGRIVIDETDVTRLPEAAPGQMFGETRAPTFGGLEGSRAPVDTGAPGGFDVIDRTGAGRFAEQQAQGSTDLFGSEVAPSISQRQASLGEAPRALHLDREALRRAGSDVQEGRPRRP